MEACLVRSRAEAMNGQTRASISILTPSPKRIRPQTDAHQSLLAPQHSPFKSSSPGNARGHDPLRPETEDSHGSIDEDSGELGDFSLRDQRRTPDYSVDEGERGSGGCSQPEERYDGYVRAGARDFDDPIEAEGRRSDGSTGEETRNADYSMIAQLSVSDDTVDPGRGRCNASIEAETRDDGVPMEVETRTSASLENNTAKTKNPSSNGDSAAKKPKKKPVNVWAKSSSRKGGKKSSKTSAKPNSITKSVSHPNLETEQCVYIIPAKNQDKAEDGPGMPVLLSKFHKSEKIELSEDRLAAGSSKGYRMVRATRGVTGGAWFFEILIEKLGKTGHTRLGWSTQKGELQAPVGFDANSYGYRDVDGSKVHMAVREKYGERYWEGDVIGFYINLPGGEALAPKSASLVSYKGQPYVVDQREEPPKVVSGSEIAFFRNGVFQGVAFKDIFAGRYFPAASMYTLPNEPNCTVRFNFGPAFRFPPLEMGDDRPAPQALCNAPHSSLDFAPSWMSESQGVNAGQTLEPYKTVEASQ